MNYLTGKVQILEQKLGHEQKDNDEFRKSLADMEQSLLNTSSVLQEKVYNSTVKRKHENFTSYYDRRKNSSMGKIHAFPSASDSDTCDNSEVEYSVEEDMMETTLMMHSKSLVEDKADAGYETFRVGMAVEAEAVKSESEQEDESEEDLSDTALILTHSKSFIKNDDDANIRQSH